MDAIVPAKINAGLTFSKLVTLTGYRAPDWQLEAILRGPGVINLVATAEGPQHRLASTASDTAAWAPGLYAYAVRATRTDGTVVQIDAGTTEVLPDLAQSSGGDMRSHARITLENIRAVIENRATQDQQRYVIETGNSKRELWRTPLADLLKLEAIYAARVKAEEAKASGKSIFGQTVRMRLA